MKEIKKLRTIKPEDLFKLKFLQDGRLSPDGKTIAYSVSHIDAEVEKECVTIWLFSLETGESRQLTSGLARDTNPHWSPDSKQIAFLTTRGDKPQIHLIPVDGGESRALTSMPLGVEGDPVWSPEGKFIAFTSSPADEPTDRSKPYRIKRHIYRFNDMGYLEDEGQDIYLVSTKGGEPIQLTKDNWFNSEPVWSPDGKEILFTAEMSPDSHRVQPFLKVVNINGEVREIIGEWGYAISAAWMPEGEQIVFIGNPLGLPDGSNENLWVVDSQGGEPECRTAGLSFQLGGDIDADIPIGALLHPRILITKDNQTAFVQVQDGGTLQIYRVALSGPESLVPVVAGERCCIPLGMEAGILVYAVSTIHTPLDLFTADMDGVGEQQLTHLNAKLMEEWILPPIEQLSFPGSDGVQLEGWILKPSSGNAPYPTILYIHGGPHTGCGLMFSFDFHMLAGAGYAVLFINYRGSTGYGDKFSTEIIGNYGDLDYKDLMAGVDFAIEKGITDADRLGCCGLSYGGYMSCWIVGQTNRFKAAVPENPVTNWVTLYGTSDAGPQLTPEELGGLPHEIPEVYQRCSPITFAHRCTTPTLLVQGEFDYRCPAEQSEQFYAVLKANGCIVEMLRLPQSSHGGSIEGAPIVRRAQNEALLDWMNRFVLSIESEKEQDSF